MDKKIILVALVLAVTVFVAGCTSSNPSTQPTTAGSNQVPATTAQVSALESELDANIENGQDLNLLSSEATIQSP